MHESEAGGGSLQLHAFVQVRQRQPSKIARLQLRLGVVEVLLDEDVCGACVDQKINEPTRSEIRQHTRVDDAVQAQDTALTEVGKLVDLLRANHGIGREVVMHPRGHLVPGGQVPGDDDVADIRTCFSELQQMAPKIGHESQREERRSGDAQADRDAEYRCSGEHGYDGEAWQKIPLSVNSRHHDRVDDDRGDKPCAKREGQGTGLLFSKNADETDEREQAAGDVAMAEQVDVVEVDIEGPAANGPLSRELDPRNR